MLDRNKGLFDGCVALGTVVLAAAILSLSCGRGHGTVPAVLLKGVAPDSVYSACLLMLDHRDRYKTNRPELAASTTIYIDLGAPLIGDPLPPPVESLRPSRVILSRGYVSIVFATGFHHLELRAYPTGKGPDALGAVPPDHRRVVNGLWLIEQ